MIGNFFEVEIVKQEQCGCNSCRLVNVGGCGN